MDDMAFPSFSSAKTRARSTQFGETGDAVVRELDMSKITLRLREKQDKKGEGQEDTIAKLQGQTIDVLQRCLVSLQPSSSSHTALSLLFQYKPTELVLKGQEGAASRITVSLKYIPIKMDLDPSESINNMGTLRVDVLDADDLPAADRNGYSDPYCKFNLNGKEIHKTKTQKKTLHPSWNEFFECPIPSRTAADFKVTVMDWDFGDKSDLLGKADINLQLLEPFTPKEVILTLDGKSGVLRLKMTFKPDYVTRSRQGSSTFSGTFETPGKIVGAPVKGVGKVGGFVGGGAVKGASFLRHGFKSKKDGSSESNGGLDPTREEAVMNGEPDMPAQPPTPMIDRSPMTPTHKRTPSFGAASIASRNDGTPSKAAESGTAQFLISSASGFSGAAKLQVHVKQVQTKGTKEVHKTKGVKSADGTATFSSEMFKVACTPDTQFQIQVMDDKFLGDRSLGEALFFIADSAQGQEKAVKVGEGTVVLTTTFFPVEAGTLLDSPKSRRSFLSKRDRNVSGQSARE